MTKSNVFWVIVLVVAVLAYTGNLPGTSPPSPPTSVAIATASATLVPTATTEIVPDDPGNIPINAHLAVQGDVWVTPTPDPNWGQPTQVAIAAIGDTSERYGDLPTSLTIPPDVWQTWPCNAASGWPQSHRQWCPLITYFAKKAVNGFTDINPDVVLGYMKFECPSGQPDCQNPTSAATGLCQVMPSGDPRSLQYVNANGVPYFSNRPSVSQLVDPVLNIAFCMRLVGGYIAAEGNERDGFRRLGHQYDGDIYKETRTIEANVLQFAGYDPWP